MDTTKTDSKPAIIARRIEILMENVIGHMRIDRLDNAGGVDGYRLLLVALASLQGPKLIRWLQDAYQHSRIPTPCVDMVTNVMALLVDAYGYADAPEHLESVHFRYDPTTESTAMERWFQPKDMEEDNKRLDSQSYGGSIEYAMVVNLVSRSSSNHLT